MTLNKLHIPELTIVVHLELDSGISACNFRTSSLSSSSVILAAPVFLLLDMPYLTSMVSLCRGLLNKSTQLEVDGKNELLKKRGVRFARELFPNILLKVLI